MLRPYSQKVTQSLQCESRILGSRTVVSVAITVTARLKPRQTVSGPTMRTLCYWNVFYSDAHASVVIVLCQWLNQQQKYSRNTRQRLHSLCHAKRLCWCSLESNVPVLGSHIALRQLPFAKKSRVSGSVMH